MKHDREEIQIPEYGGNSYFLIGCIELYGCL